MKTIFILITLVIMSAALALTSCAPSQAITDKSGTQLWGENCSRCHNAPSADQYNKDQWTVIGNHMKLKAGLTDTEVKKIVAYLQGGQ